MDEENKNPTVSIIIPTYNRANLVGGAIQSVLDQTFQDFELIVVDDASADNTQEVVHEFDDPRIRYICHQENKGGAAARNTGSEMARGVYLGFLDSDDVWYSNFIEKQLSTVKTSPPEVGMGVCGMVKVGMGRRRKLDSNKLITSYYKLLGKAGGICTSSFFIKKTAFFSIGGFEERLSSFQDLDFILRMTKEYAITITDEILLEYRLGEDSISLDKTAKAQGLQFIIDRYKNDILELDVMYLYLFKLGQYYVLSNRWKKGLSFWLQSLKFKPGNLPTWKHLLVSLGGPRLYKRVLALHRKRSLKQATD